MTYQNSILVRYKCILLTNKQSVVDSNMTFWVRLYFEKETVTDPCWQVRETSRTRPSCRKDENVSCQSCQLDTGEMLLRFPRMFQTHSVHGDDWVTYSDSVGTIAFVESFYYWRRYSDRGFLFFRRGGSVQGSKRESNGNSIIIIAAGTNGTATLFLFLYPSRRPSKAAGVKAAPVASINFVIRCCAVLRLAKVHPRSQTNARIYQSVPFASRPIIRLKNH